MNTLKSLSRPILIIGGGIAGMAAAHKLAHWKIPFLLLEQSARLGGSIRTFREGPYQMEMGPFSFLPKAFVLPKLTREWGVADQLLEADPEIARNRYVLKNRKLHRVPMSPGEFLTCSLLSWCDKFRFLMEPWAKKAPDYEETVSEFVQRRAGGGFLANLIDPFVPGIVAGNPDVLSVSASFPLFVQLEQQYGSLLRAMRKRVRNGPKTKPTLFSFKSGMEALPQAFQKMYADQVRCNATVTQISQSSAGFCVTVNGEEIQTPAVLIATPAQEAGRLLQHLNPALAGLLQGIPSAPITLVHVVYRKDQVARPLDGFGFLSVRNSKSPMLGSIWGSVIFPERAPKEEVLLSYFLGGARHPKIAERSDADCLELVEQTGREVLGIREKSAHHWICRYERAIPQYLLGHKAKVEKISHLAQKTGPVFLAGNYLTGVSLEETAQCAEKVAATLASSVEL